MLYWGAPLRLTLRPKPQGELNRMGTLHYEDPTPTQLQKVKKRGLIIARSPTIAASAPKTPGGVNVQASRRARPGADES